MKTYHDLPSFAAVQLFFTKNGCSFTKQGGSILHTKIQQIVKEGPHLQTFEGFEILWL